MKLLHFLLLVVGDLFVSDDAARGLEKFVDEEDGRRVGEDGGPVREGEGREAEEGPEGRVEEEEVEAEGEGDAGAEVAKEEEE